MCSMGLFAIHLSIASRNDFSRFVQSSGFSITQIPFSLFFQHGGTALFLLRYPSGLKRINVIGMPFKSSFVHLRHYNDYVEIHQLL
jgi:hypothetical protein